MKAIRLPDELVDRLRAEAHRRVLGPSIIANHALTVWLDDHEGDPYPAGLKPTPAHQAPNRRPF